MISTKLKAEEWADTDPKTMALALMIAHKMGRYRTGQG